MAQKAEEYGSHDKTFEIPAKVSVADPDPGSGAFLTPGSGIRDEYFGLYFRELRNNFLG
jgi:hypothetical protein